MAKKKTGVVVEKQLSPREQNIAALRAIPREQRSEDDMTALSRLLGEERRDRFLRLHIKRVLKAKTAIRNLIRLANVQTYSYTDDEAMATAEAVEVWADEVRRAFAGAPKEKGLYDL